MRFWLIATVPLFLASCTSAPPLIVASDLSNRPFAFVEGGQPRGVEPQLVAAVATAMKRSLEWKRMEFGQLIDAVASGEVDVACATMGITPERAERVAFSTPYYETEISVVVPASSELRSLGDLAGKRVGASRGTTSERAVREYAPNAVVVLDRKEESSWAEMLTAGLVHAAAMDGPDAQRLVAAAPQQFRRLGALNTERYAMATHREANELRDELNRAIRMLRANGTIARLLEEHKIPASTAAE